MRRLPLLALALVALSAGPGSAAALPTALVDPKGDWAVAGQDFTAVRVGTVTVAGKPALRAEMDLGAAPTTPTTYTVNLTRDNGCEWWSLIAYDLGAPNASARLERRVCTSGTTPETVLDVPAGTGAAAVEVRGTTVVLTAPYAAGLARGVRLGGVSAVAATRFVGAWSTNPTNGNWDGAASGDYGWATFKYVLK